ncbi:glycosyltransferase [Paracraurococcus lichenis]|uniref:Glycosyltransferase n=1 Tax=Paracraurococcus lichenis TaxID=3064888 RepID=A0ABT9ED56_9PROT|nr:glycosyltransferase [Paracraurococcus sp. LOR1-02]MDO9714044.1 glycosyltransferase [Paracraurococcus sp. LOR1-02]
MSTMPLLADVSELVASPMRTGIQRVVRAMLRHWPGPRPLLPCRFDAAAGGLVPLSPRVVDLLMEATPELRALPAEALKQRVADAAGAGPQAPLDPGRYGRILVPELFFDPARCHFYRTLLQQDPGRAGFVVYDFIPWLRPELMGVDRTQHLMPYLGVLMTARHLGFISGATRDAFVHRILRREVAEGVVLPLGADGLLGEDRTGGGVPRQCFRSDRRLFVAVGSIDGRKNQDLMADCFAALRAAGVPARLAVVGGAFRNGRAQAQAAALAAASVADAEGIRHVPQATDAEIGALLGEARATLYLSEAEGYGLPPVEGLALGIPAIIGGEVPSVTELPPGGRLELPALTPAALGEAIRHLMNDAVAEALWAEAATLDLPTWRGFAAAMASWIQD